MHAIIYQAFIHHIQICLLFNRIGSLSMIFLNVLMVSAVSVFTEPTFQGGATLLPKVNSDVRLTVFDI